MSLLGVMRTTRMFLRVMGRLPVDHLWYLAKRMNNERPHRFGDQVRINTFFPPYPSLAFDRFCDHVVSRRRVPYSTYVAITGACPFQCPHCSHGNRPLNHFTTEQALSLVQQVKSLGSCILGLTGGEPLLREDLEEIIAAAGPEMSTIVFTTGHGLDRARAERLARANLTCLTVGIESADPSSHDEVRGTSGSFEEARVAAKTARDAGLYLALSTVATREKISNGELERIRQLAQEWGALELRVLAPVATGRMVGQTNAMLSADEKRFLYNFHVDNNRHKDGPAMACFAYLESADLFGCGGGYHHLFIDASGEVCPCDLTPLSFGNALTDPLDAIWKRMEAHFSAPRCHCLMAQIANQIPVGPLPLSREQSEAICPRRCSDEPLPGGFSRLLK